MSRGILGDNPDISKAMRLLTASGKLSRTGRGGRVTPFYYNVRLCWICLCVITQKTCL